MKGNMQRLVHVWLATASAGWAISFVLGFAVHAAAACNQLPWLPCLDSCNVDDFDSIKHWLSLKKRKFAAQAGSSRRWSRCFAGAGCCCSRACPDVHWGSPSECWAGAAGSALRSYFKLKIGLATASDACFDSFGMP
jgi:hypothetical protein